MEAELILYRDQIDAQPDCVDPWFRDTLQRFRTGDELAGRSISGSCLRVAYDLAINMQNPPPVLNAFERIEEANAGLWQNLMSFTVSSANEFIEHVRLNILTRLESWRDKAA